MTSFIVQKSCDLPIKTRQVFGLGLALLTGIFALLAGCADVASSYQPAVSEWQTRDPNRPYPPRVEVQAAVVTPPPSDAIVLFDGSDLSQWTNDPANGWSIQSDGTLMPGGHRRNYLASRQTFRDIQIHLEFRTPFPAAGEGQKRGNSGIFLMGIYELQIMDPVNNRTYGDGLPGSIFGQQPPLVLAARHPGEWQSYDIVFTAPRFEADKMLSPPRVTAYLNGVLVQKDRIIRGDTIPRAQPPEYQTRINAGPLVIQDHGDATGLVRFRNIWVREIKNE